NITQTRTVDRFTGFFGELRKHAMKMAHFDFHADKICKRETFQENTGKIGKHKGRVGVQLSGRSAASLHVSFEDRIVFKVPFCAWPFGAGPSGGYHNAQKIKSHFKHSHHEKNTEKTGRRPDLRCLRIRLSL